MDNIWLLLTKIDELKGRWAGGAWLHPQLLGRLKRSVLVTSTGSSTRIEGSALSDEEVESLMRNVNIQKFTERDQQEVQGYFELLAEVFERWEHVPFTENVIKQLHRELLKYVDKDERHRGEYKKLENSVEMFNPQGVSLGVIFKTTPAYLTPLQMTALLERTVADLAQAEKHPLLVIADFLVNFLAIHPFQDGNGRLSRVLTNLLLLQSGYAYVPYASHEKLIEENKTEYYVALRKSQTTLGTPEENIEPWVIFFLEACLTQARQATALLSQDTIEDLLSPKQLVVWQLLSDGVEMSSGDIARRVQMNQRTVIQAVRVLLKLKKITKLGAGRATRYVKI